MVSPELADDDSADVGYSTVVLAGAYGGSLANAVPDAGPNNNSFCATVVKPVPPLASKTCELKLAGFSDVIAEPSPVMVVAETLSAMTLEFNVREDSFVATTLAAKGRAVKDTQAK